MIRLTAFLFVLLVIQAPVVSATSKSYQVGEQELQQYLEDLFQTDIFSEYGFTTDDMEQISFGKPVAINNLKPSFAFGENDVIIQDDVEEWISIVYENDRPVNGIRLNQGEGGQLEVSGFGYPLDLAAEIALLDDKELLFYEFPTGYYYALNEDEDSVRLLEVDSKDQVQNISIEEFQTLLVERYENGYGGSVEPQRQISWLYSTVGAGTVLISTVSLIVWRKKKFKHN